MSEVTATLEELAVAGVDVGDAKVAAIAYYSNGKVKSVSFFRPDDAEDQDTDQ